MEAEGEAQSSLFDGLDGYFEDSFGNGRISGWLLIFNFVVIIGILTASDFVPSKESSGKSCLAFYFRNCGTRSHGTLFEAWRNGSSA